MRIRTRNGHILLVLKDVETKYYGRQALVFVDAGGFVLGSDYTEDMTDINDSGYDIVEVYNTTGEDAFNREVLNLDVRTSIWKRVEYTDEQKTVLNALKVLGYNYIAKDMGDIEDVYAFASCPVKRTAVWGRAMTDVIDIPCLRLTNSVISDLVSWDDVEPLKI